jgi:hypothetical protein
MGVLGCDPLEDVASGIETGRIGHRDLDNVTLDADPEGGPGADGDDVAVVDHDGMIDQFVGLSLIARGGRVHG